MAIKFEKIEAGMVLHDVHSHKMGNTTMTTLGHWEVRIISVDAEKRTAVVRWNGNPEQKYSERQLTALYAKLPPKYLAQQERKRANGREW